MYKQCWGCDKNDVSIFAWLASDNICVNCKKDSYNILTSEKYKINSEKARERFQKRVEKNNAIFKFDHNKVTAVKENSKLVFGALFGLFLLWVMLGGLLEDQSSQNVVNIDCRDPGMANSRYCNGDFESQSQAADAAENSYYQDIVR